MIVASALMVHEVCSMASMANKSKDGVLRRCRFVVVILIADHRIGMGSRICNNLGTGKAYSHMHGVVVFPRRVADDSTCAINNSSATPVCRGIFIVVMPAAGSHLAGKIADANS